jgi:hypothetical protein
MELQRKHCGDQWVAQRRVSRVWSLVNIAAVEIVRISKLPLAHSPRQKSSIRGRLAIDSPEK